MAKKRFEPKTAAAEEPQAKKPQPPAVEQPPEAAQVEPTEPAEPQAPAPEATPEPPAEPDGAEADAGRGGTIEQLTESGGIILHADGLAGIDELPEDVNSVILQIPLVPEPGKLGYAAQDPDIHFTRRQAVACKAMAEGLARAGVPIKRQRDAIGWMMDRVADALEGK